MTGPRNKLSDLNNHLFEQLEFLKGIAPGKSYKKITEIFNKKYKENRSLESVGSFMNENGVKNGIDERFAKGDIPSCYRAVGSERVTVDGYIEIKIKDPNIWELKHRYLWEKENGKIEEGYSLIFADGDRQNTNLENLILVSRHELLEMNRQGLYKKNKDLTETGHTIAKLNIKIMERGKRD